MGHNVSLFACLFSLCIYFISLLYMYTGSEQFVSCVSGKPRFYTENDMQGKKHVCHRPSLASRQETKDECVFSLIPDSAFIHSPNNLLLVGSICFPSFTLCFGLLCFCYFHAAYCFAKEKFRLSGSVILDYYHTCVWSKLPLFVIQAKFLLVQLHFLTKNAAQRQVSRI